MAGRAIGGRGAGARVRLQWYEVGQRRMPVVDQGDPAAQPAVLVPGLSDGLAPVTLPATQALLADAPLPMQRFRCLLLSYADRPADDVTTTEGLAAEVAELLDQAVDRPCWLFAHSMGAMVAQHLAASRPDLVAGLVLSASVARADEALRRHLEAWRLAVEARDWHRFARLAVDASFTGPGRWHRRAMLRLSRQPDHPDERVARHVAFTTAACTHDASEVLGAISAPTLVLTGGRDPLCRADRGQELAAAIDGATYVEFADLAHGFPEQAPDRFAAAVLDFLDQHSRLDTTTAPEEQA
jgi:pimeloyl-ACP methyl ester carboxylesterase